MFSKDFQHFHQPNPVGGAPRTAQKRLETNVSKVFHYFHRPNSVGDAQRTAQKRLETNVSKVFHYFHRPNPVGGAQRTAQKRLETNVFYIGSCFRLAPSLAPRKVVSIGGHGGADTISTTSIERRFETRVLGKPSKLKLRN